MEEKTKKEEGKEEKNKKVNEKNAIDKKKQKDEKKEEEQKEMQKFKPVENQQEKFSTTNKKKVIIISVCIIVALLIFSTIFAVLNIGNEKILSGVSIKGVDMSNLTKAEAQEKLEKIYSEKIKKEIGVKYKEYESSINPLTIETKYDIEKAVEEAESVGKKDNIFVNNFEILKTYLFKTDIPVNMTINEETTKQTIDNIGLQLPGIVVESSYYQEDDNLIINKGKAGIAIDKDDLMKKIKEELDKIEVNQGYIEISVINKEPEPINIEKIHEEVHKEVQDAYYTKDPFEIHPEVEGVDFDVEAAKIILAEDKEEYVIPLVITKPKVTIDQIGTEAFPDLLATFTTKYDASNTDRTTNLRIACQKINGKIVLAGETFSYNKTLGERTAAAGYKNGKIYSQGEVVDGIGGGICQISSTLYNAVLMANLEVTERKNHQFVTSYLPAGRDATVSYGSIDFKFKNTRTYPVRIVANLNNGIATVSIYGIKEDNEYTITISTKTVSTIPYSTQYEEDASIPLGEEQVRQRGVDGLVTETYITKTLNGKVESSKLLSRDTYSAMQQIILRGSGSPNPTPTEPTNTTPTTNTTETNTTNTTNTTENTTNTTNMTNTTNTTENTSKQNGINE